MKWVGACLAAAACIALGFGFAAALNARVRALGDAVRALRLLSHRIVLLSEPMRDALLALKDESPLFQRALDAMRDEPEDALQRALAQTRELSDKDTRVILGMLNESGSSGRAEQERIFAVGIERLAGHERAAAEKAASDAKLYRTLGLLAAAVILIITL